MKKFLCLFLSLFLTLSLVACSDNKDEINNDDNVIKNIDKELENEKEEKEILSDKKSGEEDTTNSDENEMNIHAVYQFIRLEENPTTGYGWRYKVLDENIAVVESDEYTPNNNDDRLVGGGGVHTYRICGLSSGDTEIIFDYLRAWEGEDSIQESVIFSISVNENNEIAIVDEKRIKEYNL